MSIGLESIVLRLSSVPHIIAGHTRHAHQGSHVVGLMYLIGGTRRFRTIQCLQTSPKVTFTKHSILVTTGSCQLFIFETVSPASTTKS
jgi:hypothetical protein